MVWYGMVWFIEIRIQKTKEYMTSIKHSNQSASREYVCNENSNQLDEQQQRQHKRIHTSDTGYRNILLVPCLIKELYGLWKKAVCEAFVSFKGAHSFHRWQKF